MLHGRNKYIVLFLVGVFSVFFFLLFEEVGRLIYMKFFIPTSRGRALYYAIWIFSIYLAPAGLLLSCFFNLKFQSNLIFFMGFCSAVIYTFRDNPLWATLLLRSYLLAILLALILKWIANRLFGLSNHCC